MDILITIIAAIALIPSVLFLYGNLSLLVQSIFIKNFDDTLHAAKWRLYSYSSYTIMSLCILSFLNMISINSESLDVVVSYGTILAAYWYLASLIKYHYNSFVDKLD